MMYNALEVKKNIYWVGALDKDIRIFDIIMYTKYGTTYNSYIVKTSKATILFEISKEQFFDQFIERVREVCDPGEIDYVVVNHTEPDHTGSLIKLFDYNPNLTVIGTNTAIKFLKEITNSCFPHKIVKDGETLNFGDKTLRFIVAPFLHWPDTMFTYIEEDQTLLGCDFLGSHYATENIFNDQLPAENEAGFMEAFRHYYDCIMYPFKAQVINALDKLQGLDIQTVCTGHGLILRTNIQKYMDLYREWSTPVLLEKPIVVIPYVSSYGYTRELAYKIKEGILSAGEIDVFEYDLVTTDLQTVLDKLLNATGIVVGSPTLVGDALPPIWKLLSDLNPVIHKGMIAGAFGSYGWSGEAVQNIEQRLKQLKFQLPFESIKVLFKPNEADLEEAIAYGNQFGEAVLVSHNKKR